MKYSFEARAEASENRQRIIDTNVNCAIEGLEACIDRTIEKGYFVSIVNLSELLEDFDTEIKEEITKHLSMYGYNVKWCNSTITVSFKGD